MRLTLTTAGELIKVEKWCNPMRSMRIWGLNSTPFSRYVIKTKAIGLHLASNVYHTILSHFEQRSNAEQFKSEE